MIGWGPTFSGDDREIASRPDLAAFLRDAAIADGDGIGGEGYVFGDGSAW